MNLRLFTLILFISFHCNSQSLLQDAKYSFYNGEFNKSISLLEKYNKIHVETPYSYQLLANNYLKLNEAEQFHLFSNKAFSLIRHKTTIDTALHYANLSEYYHYMLRTDSSTYFAVASLNLMEHSKNVNDSIKCRIYSVYGNSMRNASHHFKNIHNRKENEHLKKSRNVSIKYMEEALRIANKYEQPYLLRMLGTTYNDLVSISHSNKEKLRGYKEVLAKTIEYYNRGIEVALKIQDNPDLFICQTYSLIGLTYFYDNQFELADEYYLKAQNIAFQNNKIKYLNQFNLIASWRGWLYEIWYEETDSIDLLYKSLKIYESSVEPWLEHFDKFGDSIHGLDDGYRISTLHKIPGSCYHLYNETRNKSYVNKALYYSDLDLYLSYHKRKLHKDTVTIQALQNLLDDEAIVFYINSANPNITHALIIEKNNFRFIKVNEKRLKYENSFLKRLTNFSDEKEFKYSSYNVYKNLFEPIDQYLSEQNRKNIIIIPAGGIALINFDILISDTLNNGWKNQPYLFNKYNISYALSPTILLDNCRNSKTEFNKIGILKGTYNKKYNPLFTNQLLHWVESNFESKISNDNEEKKIYELLTKNSIAFISGHGEGSYTRLTSNIFLDDTHKISSDFFYNHNLDNELVITTACSTDPSQVYFSEGAAGGFTRAFMYAGAKSSLTSFWDVDDKVGADILKSFIIYLQEGKKKSEALWLAKKAYWDKAKNNEEFSPLYWSAYKLTGNTKSVRLANKWSSYNLLNILFLFVGIFAVLLGRYWYKSSFSKS